MIRNVDRAPYYKHQAAVNARAAEDYRDTLYRLGQEMEYADDPVGPGGFIRRHFFPPGTKGAYQKKDKHAGLDDAFVRAVLEMQPQNIPDEIYDHEIRTVLPLYGVSEGTMDELEEEAGLLRQLETQLLSDKPGIITEALQKLEDTALEKGLRYIPETDMLGIGRGQLMIPRDKVLKLECEHNPLWTHSAFGQAYCEELEPELKEKKVFDKLVPQAAKGDKAIQIQFGRAGKKDSKTDGAIPQAQSSRTVVHPYVRENGMGSITTDELFFPFQASANPDNRSTNPLTFPEAEHISAVPRPILPFRPSVVNRVPGAEYR